MTKISVLDLSPIVEGSNAGEALANSLDLAQHAEALGYTRYWVAEHHNIQGIASAATAVVICHIATGTQSIRVGAGGIMLPNHAPLVIAEQFGTLASLFPDRIDLGIGRAPGTDVLTSKALRRTLQGRVGEFPADVQELQTYLDSPQPGQQVIATPGAGTHVPIWILGSSLYGAQLAAMLGLPFAFASHFAPTHMLEALEIYRSRFQPSASLSEPYVMLGFNICAAPTLEEAQYLRSSSVLSYLSTRKGAPRQLPPPTKDIDKNLDEIDRVLLKQMDSPTAMGDQQSVTSALQDFIALTNADELMLVCSIFDHQKRVDSFRIAAAAASTLSVESN